MTKSTYVRLFVYVSRDTKAKMKRLAKAQDCSIAEIVREWIEDCMPNDCDIEELENEHKTKFTKT